MHLVSGMAWCTVCDWETEAQNAMGTAAKHYQKYGHPTHVQLVFIQIFGDTVKRGEAQASTGKPVEACAGQS